MCGEYALYMTTVAEYIGSPPRVWGIPPVSNAPPCVTRITPTCVGNTVRQPISMKLRRDHPHVCGEYGSMALPYKPPLGSPPRVWGIQQVGIPSKDEIRITPTCVGNTLRQRFARCLPRDHPHVCGEYAVFGGLTTG